MDLKMIMSEPRPIWVWPDISETGCKTSFGSPSGHSTRSANLALMFILDLFFASEWSRKKHEGLNQMRVGTHKLTFALATLLGLSFWIFNVYNRIYIGKHTLDQVLLGS